jgi:hypothetical protein
MVVMRPGDARCTNCNSDPDYKASPKEQVKRIKSKLPE